MAIAPRLEARQSQSLVMTPQLLQAIKLLQLSNLDLVAYVDAELERNPLLERNDNEDGSSSEEDDGKPVDSAAAESERASSQLDGPDSGSGSETRVASEGGEGSDWVDAQIEREPATIADKLDADFGNVYHDDGPGAVSDPGSFAGDPWQSGGSTSTAGDGYNLESFVAQDVSLADHLGEQMPLVIADPADRLIARNLIDNLDDAGYLRADLAEIGARLGVSVTVVEHVLGLMQTLEPTGVFGRDLSECLKLQLVERNRYDPAMAQLLAHIELLGKRDYPALKRLCGVDDEDLAQMIHEIKALDPRPGSAFGAIVMQPVVPDVIVRPASDGGWTIELNSDNLPKVLINQTYYAKVHKTTRDEAGRAYLTDCLQSANWLVKSLDQRAKTILKVASEIVRQQDAFLTWGVQHLRPLNLRTVADAIGMHESTVSRVTSNKYMATTRGIFELKYFFTSAIASSQGGDAHSAEAVRHRVRQMIDQESADDILSDDTIVTLLKQAGVDIARRTVAKYRESLRIPSSVQRRREKKR